MERDGGGLKVTLIGIGYGLNLCINLRPETLHVIVGFKFLTLLTVLCCFCNNYDGFNVCSCLWNSVQDSYLSYTRYAN